MKHNTFLLIPIVIKGGIVESLVDQSCCLPVKISIANSMQLCQCFHSCFQVSLIKCAVTILFSDADTKNRALYTSVCRACRLKYLGRLHTVCQHRLHGGKDRLLEPSASYHQQN